MNAKLPPNLEMPVCAQAISPAIPRAHDQPRKKCCRHRQQVPLASLKTYPAKHVEQNQQIVADKKCDVQQVKNGKAPK